MFNYNYNYNYSNNNKHYNNNNSSQQLLSSLAVCNFAPSRLRLLPNSVAIKSL